MPKGVYERKPRLPKPEALPKRKGRPPKAQGFADALTQLRAERDRLVDRVAAIGTAIDALEAIEA